MNIGIILYSCTGNTLSVAEKLREQLEAKGHAVTIEQITISGKAEPGKFELTAAPSPEPYDAVVFGSPVQAFSLNPVTQAYLKRLPTLAGKKVALLVTKQLPFYWTGGTRAASTMKKICQEKGAKVLGSGIAIWAQSKREATVKSAVEGLSGLF